MANYVAITGIIDQIGGSFILPPSETHIPRYQGNFFTLPAGLQIKGNRKFIWSVDTLNIPGVIAITNATTATPTIEFNSNVYSGVSLKIRCTIIGQPRNFIEYTLFTASTSVSTTACYSISNITDNNFFNIRNINITGANNSLITDSNSYTLRWARPLYEKDCIYIVEVWNDGWSALATTSATAISILNSLTSYRIKTIYLNSEIQTDYINYGAQSNGLNYLSNSSNIAYYNSVSNINNFNQNLNPLPLFTSIENTTIQSNILTYYISTSTLNNFNQNLNGSSFFSSVENNLSISNIISYYVSNNNLLNFTQNTNPNIFWSESTGA